MNLINVNGWYQIPERYAGRYRDDNGNALSGIFRKECKKMNDTLFINNGNRLTTYKYPNISVPFSSPMHRWENLYYCGGFSVTMPDGTGCNDNERLIDDVINGLKPMGFVVCRENQVDLFISKATAKGLPYVVLEHSWKGHKEVGIANVGKLDKLFDIKALIESYQLYEKQLSETLIDSWTETLLLCNSYTLEDYLEGYDYANPKTEYDYILNGLILGYPIQSTVAFMTGSVR